MMKTIILLLSGFFSCFSVCNAQTTINWKLKIEKSHSSYCVNNEVFLCVIYNLKNEGKETIWLWFDKKTSPWLPDSTKIKDYFFRNKTGSDVSLFQIGVDGGVETFIPGIFETFIKRIPTNNVFTIQIISRTGISAFTEKRILDYLDNHIVLIPEKTIFKCSPSLKEMNQIIFFKGELIILFTDMLNFN